MTACRAGAVAAAALVLTGAAQASAVAVVVVPPFEPETYSGRGAVGLMPPGDGTTVSGEGALAALVRGRTEKSLLGGAPGGQPLVELSKRPAAVTIYVSLPPPGDRANDTRYPVAIVGGGYRGILESPSTRIPGLVSIADIAPTALGLRRGEQPRIGWTPGTAADLRELDVRLSDQDVSRNAAVGILAALAVAFALAGIALGSPLLARAAVLAAPLALGTAIALSAAGISRPAWQLPLLAAVTGTGAAAASSLLPDRRALAGLMAGLILAYLAVLVVEPTWAALASIGPNPGEGGRFYGSTNLTTSIVLAACLFAGAALGLRGLAAVAVLSLVTVGWSKAGADGGGIVVVGAASIALGARLATGRLTARAAAVSAALAVAAGLGLVGLDAALGGSSHVTDTIGDGPGALLSSLGDRIEISVERVVSSWHAALVLAVSLTALTALALRRPTFTGAEALLLGIAVSLLVNDTPQHVAAAGAIAYGAWWAYERSASPDRLSDHPPGQ